MQQFENKATLVEMYSAQYNSKKASCLLSYCSLFSPVLIAVNMKGAFNNRGPL